MIFEQLGALINVPLMVLFNKTSIEMFGVDDGGIMMLSIASWTNLTGMAFSIFGVLPLVDYLGRRPVCIYIKVALATAGTSLCVLAWLLQNGVFYLLAVAFFAAPKLPSTKLARKVARPRRSERKASSEKKERKVTYEMEHCVSRRGDIHKDPQPNQVVSCNYRFVS
ncbi:unnamed protein product, partial [Mesorhabditis spiculigera]